MVLAMIHVDAIFFSSFRDWRFLVKLHYPIVKRPNFRRTEQEGSPSVCRNTGVVLMQNHAWIMNVRLFLVMMIFLNTLDVIFYDKWFLNMGHKTVLQRLVPHQRPAFLLIFTSFCVSIKWPYHIIKYVNRIPLNHTSL